MNSIQRKAESNCAEFSNDCLRNALHRMSDDFAVDMYELNNNVVIETGLPGVVQSEIMIVIDGAQLIISGHREDGHSLGEREYYSKEISRGYFTRTINLPASVDDIHSSATFKEGVLKIHLPVRVDTDKKLIQIMIGDD